MRRRKQQAYTLRLRRWATFGYVFIVVFVLYNIIILGLSTLPRIVTVVGTVSQTYDTPDHRPVLLLMSNTARYCLPDNFPPQLIDHLVSVEGKLSGPCNLHNQGASQQLTPSNYQVLD